MTPEDVTAFAWSADRDPNGSRLRTVLAAQAAYERARLVRELFVHAVAAAGAPLWLFAVNTRQGVGTLRTWALAGWAAACAGLALAALVEWRSMRRRSRSLSELEPRADSITK